MAQDALPKALSRTPSPHPLYGPALCFLPRLSLLTLARPLVPYSPCTLTCLQCSRCCQRHSTAYGFGQSHPTALGHCGCLLGHSEKGVSTSQGSANRCSDKTKPRRCRTEVFFAPFCRQSVAHRQQPQPSISLLSRPASVCGLTDAYPDGAAAVGHLHMRRLALHLLRKAQHLRSVLGVVAHQARCAHVACTQGQARS